MRLLEMLLEAIPDNIDFTKLKQLSKGGHKYVYVDDDNPDFVIKTWKPTGTVDDIIKREYDIYKRNRDMFAPIERMDFDNRVMIQKKLDIGKAQQDMQKLKKYLKPFYTEYPDYVLQDLPQYFEALVEDPAEYKKAKAAITNAADLVIFERWYDFVEEMLSMDKTFINKMGNTKDYIIDLHDGNVGYDTDGKLKFIDI
jgi:hypothetical protein